MAIINLHSAYKSKVLAFDVETNAKDPRWDPEFQLMGISLAWRDELGIMNSEYYAFHHWDENDSIDDQNKVVELLTEHPCLTTHNAPTDLLFLGREGIHPKGKIYCTMLMSHFINENLFSKELDWLGKRFLGRGKVKSQEFETVLAGYGWGLMPAKFMKHYAANDAELHFDLFQKLYPKFVSEGYESLWEREMKFAMLIKRMETQGIYVDQQYCKDMADKGIHRMAELFAELGFNPSSNPQLGEHLINVMGLPVVKRTPKTKVPSFDKEAMIEYETILEARDNPTARNILEYRGWQKTVSSNYRAYLDLLNPDGKLRCNYKLHVARTTRLSCAKPNLQQIPKSSDKPWNGGLRAAFHGSQGFGLFGFDYSNLELRLAAILSKERKLIDAFNSGVKIFQVMADDLEWDYDPTKRFVYATLYGGGVTRIKNIFNIDEDDARDMRKNFFKTYPALFDKSQEVARLAMNRGYIKLWTGRRRHFEDPEKEKHKAFNSWMQGGAAELIKDTMLTIADEIDWDTCKMLLQVHDEVIAEHNDPKWDKVLIEIMSDVASLDSKFDIIPFPVEKKVWNVRSN